MPVQYKYKYQYTPNANTSKLQIQILLYYKYKSVKQLRAVQANQGPTRAIIQSTH